MSQVAITIDVDWAPDFVIDDIAQRLITYGVKATWFVTHRSPAIERLRRWPDLFELGIHPNVLPGSTHGSTPEEVLEHCMALVPDATSMRTHGLVQSTLLLAQVMEKSPITADVSLFLPHSPYLHPVSYQWASRELLRIPYFWEDDFEMERNAPCWRLSPLLALGNGQKIFDFHPIHVYLNSRDPSIYQALKRSVPNLAAVEPELLRRHIVDGDGTQTLFLELIDYVARTGASIRIQDIEAEWRRGPERGKP